MNKGLGVMINELFGNKFDFDRKVLNEKITNAEILSNVLVLTFESGYKLDIFDNGQSCCESRYMTCDDDVSRLVGGKLTDVVEKDSTSTEDGDWGNVNEIMFVEVKTDQDSIVLQTHNEHNGYYGGFSLTVKGEDKND